MDDFTGTNAGRGRPARRAVVWLTLSLAVAGCSAQPLPPGQAVITLGHETDTWTRAPAVTSARVDKVLDTGKTILVTSGAAPLTKFSLGNGGKGYYQVTGSDAQGIPRVWGRTLEVDPVNFAGLTLPVFVGRARAFARAPSGLSDPQSTHPPAVVVGKRYILAAGGKSGDLVRADAYDLALWEPDRSANLGCPSPPCRFQSLLVAGNSGSVIAIGGSWAIGFDVFIGTSGNIALPTGLKSFGDVAGGRTVNAPDGSAYVVGATRASPPTASVLAVAADGTLSSLSLAVPRAGAQATWVDGRGLVVEGGSATGPGAELLPVGASAFVPLPFPSDPTQGAALAPLDATTLVRAGGHDQQGVAPTVELSLSCTENCAPAVQPESVALDPAQGFGFDTGGEVLLVGRDPTGATAAARVDSTGVSAVPLREPRRNATALALPNGQVAVLGGTHLDGTPATSLELYSP